MRAAADAHVDSLAALEQESIYILREAFSKIERLAMLWSMGKDSTVLLWLARKAFFGHVPYPLIHIDTSYKIPEMIEYRDRLVRELGLELVIGQNTKALAEGMNHKRGRLVCCTALKTEALRQVIEQHKFRAIIVGIRRDEEGSRATQPEFGVGRRGPASRVLGSVSHRLSPGRTCSRPSHSALDRTRRVAIYRARKDSSDAVVLCRKRKAVPEPRVRALHEPVRFECRVGRGDHRRAERDEGERALGTRSGPGAFSRNGEAPPQGVHVVSPVAFVVVGHVDHGKSTLIGRLLVDTESLQDGRLEKVRQICREQRKPFEYAFLLDALEAEQLQGVTIDITEVRFRWRERQYLIIDAPGHKEFRKNMLSGAAHADAALLVIDAGQGVQEQSRRHAAALRFLGIKEIAIIISKMDVVDYSEEVFHAIRVEYERFLASIDVQA